MQLKYLVAWLMTLMFEPNLSKPSRIIYWLLTPYTFGYAEAKNWRQPLIKFEINVITILWINKITGIIRSIMDVRYCIFEMKQITKMYSNLFYEPWICCTTYHWIIIISLQKTFVSCFRNPSFKPNLTIVIMPLNFPHFSWCWYLKEEGRTRSINSIR